jgi:DcmR-like sensory protein
VRTSGTTSGDPASPSDVAGRPRPPGHLVLAYTDDRHLARVVADYVAAGISQHEPAVIIATPPHARLFAQRLALLGIDAAGAIERRDILVLDAQETLATFMVDGWPDRDGFRSVLAAALEHVRPSGAGAVRLYGEMVELLWRDSVDATMELERMWNEAIAGESVSLLCGYRLDGLDRRMQGMLRSISRCHAQLLPIEDQPRLDQAVTRAYAEVFGPGDDTRKLRALMVTSADLGTVMPDAQAALLALDSMPPVIANDVRSRARRHYAGA